MSKEICNCKDENFIKSDGSFDVSSIFINKYAPINENSRFDIISGKITNLNTNRVNCDTSNCNPTKQQKLSVRNKPTPYRVPYNHYRKRFTCDTDNSGCSTNIKIIKDVTCDVNCQKSTYGITRLVDKGGVRLRNNGGNYINYLQSAGKTHKQHSTGILPELRSNHDSNSYKINNTGTVYNKNLNITDNSNCGISYQKPDSLLSQSLSFKNIPITIRKYNNKGFSSNTSVSSKNRLLQLKHNTILAGQMNRRGYNNCINGQLCSLYQQSGPNTKMKTSKRKCKRFTFKGVRQSCFMYRGQNIPGLVNINGINIRGNKLRAMITESNRYSISGVTFQWLRNNIEISGAIYQEYLLVPNDVNTNISVEIQYIDNLGYHENATSAQTNIIKDTNSIGSLTFSTTPTNTYQKHSVLTINIQDNDSPYTDVSYRWSRVDENDVETLINETRNNYVLTHIDVSKKIKVVVTYTDNNNTIETITSPLTPVIQYPPNQPGVVSITGPRGGTPPFGKVGETLTSTIVDNNGITGVYIEYIWYRISNSTITTISNNPVNYPGHYQITIDDIGSTIKLKVRYIDNDRYIQEPISSITQVITI